MGYRGEDASRTRVGSRRQSPWQSSNTGPGAAGSWDERSQGYGQDDGYPSGGAYDSDAGHADYGQGGGYGATDGYGTTGRHGYGDGYGTTGSYGVTGTYDASGPGGYGQRDSYRYGEQSGYPDANGQPDANGYAGGGYDSGYDQEARYEQEAGYGHTGAYGQLAGYRDSDAGYRDSGQHPQNRHADAGNDWYNGQPGAASGSGFADTGVHTFGTQALESYGAARRDPVRGFPPAPGRPLAELEAGSLQGLARTGQQERYDDTQYDSYPAYGGQDNFDSPHGYRDSGGHRTSSDYDYDYDEPQAFGAGGYDTGVGYDTGSHTDPGLGYDDFEDVDDPYQERYRDDGTAPRPASTGGRKNKKDKRNKTDKKSRSGKRSKRPLLLSILALVAIGVAGAAGYTFLKPKPPAGNPLAATGALPTSGTSITAATAACARQLGGVYCHIESRADDPVPLTLAELFPPAFTNETDHTSFTRIGTRLDKTCSNAVIGQDLIAALKSDSCTQVLRASYVSGDNTIMGTIGVINLATTNEAHHAGKVVGANDFIAPLSTKTGIGAKLGSGTGVVEAEFKGHYLILTWAEFVDGKTPKTTAQDTQLEQFETDLVAGTANIDLSQRMVNGVKATAAG